MRYIDRYRDELAKTGKYYDQAGFHFVAVNPIAQSTRFDTYFGELSDVDSETFEELYVKPLSKNISEVELHLLSDITKINVTAWRKFYSSTGQTFPPESLVALQNENEGPRIIQIVAPIGTGKSTYLAHFLRFVVTKVSGSRYNYFHATFDCKKHWIRGTPIEMAIYGFLQKEAEILFPCFSNKDAQDFYKNGYQSRLSVFGPLLRRKGINDLAHPIDSSTYREQLKCIDEHCAQPGYWAESIQLIYSFGMAQHADRKFIFALDNVDLFAELHPGDAIGVLNQIGGMLKTDTIVTLRDTTYRIIQPHARCTSWHRPTTIILPSLESGEIAQRRLTKLKSVLQKETASKENKFYRFIANVITQIGRPHYLPAAIDLRIIRDWLDNLSNHNTRDMLDILLQALKSHHLTSETFAKRFVSTFYFDPKNNIHVKRFKTAFIIGTAPYFSEADARTNVVNLFDAQAGVHTAWADERRIFCLKILQYLAKLGAFKIEDVLKNVENMLGKTYVNPAKDCVRRFWQKGLIIVEGLDDSKYFTESAKEAEFETIRVQKGQSFVTPNGRFHLQTLICDDIYLDEMKFATDLSDDEFRTVFDNRNQEAGAYYRLRATGAFCRLVSDQEEKCANLSRVLGVVKLGPMITDAYNERKSAERAQWKDM